MTFRSFASGSFLSASLAVYSCFGLTPPDPATPLVLQETRTLITQADLTAMGLVNFDAPITLVELSPGDYWMYLSEGGKYDGRHSRIVRVRTDLTRIDPSTLEEVEISGIPDAGVNEFNGWKAWLLNLHSPGGKEWIAILHLENQDNGVKELFRQGTAYSSDGGRTFRFLGFCLSPHLADEVVQRGKSKGLINLAGGGFRLDREYAYLYFSDMSREDRSDRRIATARAPLATLAADARAGRNTAWFKYHNGSWNEPGLGGASASLGEGLVEWHTSVSYNTYIDRWITFSMKGGNLIMRRSPDPMNFHVSDEVICPLPEGAVAAAYFLIQSPEDGPAECGKKFYLYYRTVDGSHKQYQLVRQAFSFGAKK